MSNSTSIPGRLRPTQTLVVVGFLLVGMLQTVFALALFNRTDDHEYFVAIANAGTEAVHETSIEDYDLKARMAAGVFHAVASPVRWLGANESLYVLWMRLLTLGGFLLAFEAVRTWTARDPGAAPAGPARARFAAACLLYPGQLAWTASLLRDGLSCAFLFAALFAWSRKQRLLGAALLFPGLCLRPEFAAVVAAMALCGLLLSRWRSPGRRPLWLLMLLLLVSSVLFLPREASSAFAQYAYAADNAAYPVVSHPLDIAGYLLVLLQGVYDPMSIAAPGAIWAWAVAEVAYFVWLIAGALRRLPHIGHRAAGLSFGILLSMWLFAYFELYVSGFSRHRLALVILMLAVTSLTFSGRRNPRPAGAASPVPRAIVSDA